MKYKHYVFCAAIYEPKNKQSIEAALSISAMLRHFWSVEADVVENDYHSKIVEVNGDYNIEIYLENDDLAQLVKDCVEFGIEMYKKKSK